MKTKTEQMLEFLKVGAFKKALKIAKTFRIGYTKQENRLITLGYECLVFPEFYISLGKNPETCVQNAINCINEKYKEKTCE